MSSPAMSVVFVPWVSAPTPTPPAGPVGSKTTMSRLLPSFIRNVPAFTVASPTNVSCSTSETPVRKFDATSSSSMKNVPVL